MNQMANENKLDDEFDVIVIGGGCAGLACASELYSCGITNILVLEAQEYLGGRIKTDFIYDKQGRELPLETGATWIHGHSSENPLTKLVNENPEFFQHKKKDFFVLNNENVLFVDENGRVYDEDKCKQLYNIYHEWNLEAKSVWINKKTTDFTSYTEFMFNKLEKHIEKFNEEDKLLYIAVMKRLLKAETAESGCATMDLLSLNEYGSYAIPHGDDFEYPGGFSKLIEYFSRKIPQERIKINHPVKNIRLNSNKKANSRIYPLIIECFNGLLVKAKHVVVTVSVNYLKKHYKDLFDFELLTDSKIESIDKVKMDTVDKICLFYDDMSSFYPKDKLTIHPLFLNEDNQDSQSWHYKTYSFDKFYENMMIVWMTGTEADLVENLSEEEISKVLTNLLRQFLKNPTIPEPIKIMRTQWNLNKYILGGYSYVGLDGSANKHINNLAEPIYVDNVPRVLFAGEATHLRYYSTVHGAYETGIREAQRIINLHLNEH